ncbi:hypothetical protein OXV66_15090 [Bacteroides fragilis]|nr:hypothetical protein [Bacteroides fragilis]
MAKVDNILDLLLLLLRINRPSYENKLKTAITLLVYIAVTVGIYAFICYLSHQPFDDLRILYAVLIGCVAYLPRHLMIRKLRKNQK